MIRASDSHEALAGPVGESCNDGTPSDTRSMPRVVVLSQLYPRTGQETAGLFVRERMARVADRLPLVVVSPIAWFPLQGLVRLLRPHFRPPGMRHERLDGIDVYCPRWLSFPGILKRLDGWLLALSIYPSLRRLHRRWAFDILDAHFGYPDGYAAVLLGRWLGVRVSVTLRGNEARRIRSESGARQIRRVVQGADRVFTVSDSLRAVALEAGARAESVEVVTNGVDIDRFRPVDKSRARRLCGLPAASPLLVTVGTLVERKGFHRVIELLPQLRESIPGLEYAIVGGPGPEGDYGDRLRRIAEDAGVASAVHFLGPIAPDQLHVALSAADVFVLATSGEGWANVFLEAMACGLPVVTTDVGGNREVVCDDELGFVVPFGDPAALADAITRALGHDWKRARIRAYAEENSWGPRVERLIGSLRDVHAEGNRLA